MEKIMSKNENASVFDRKRWLILIIFGLIGQIAWSVENMHFNVFVFDTFNGNLDAVTLMVQMSGITATLATLLAGTLSDKLGNRRYFISFGYAIWGVTVAIFGFITPELMMNLFGLEYEAAMKAGITAVIAGDCVMTLFGSSANDSGFSAWVTDNTESSYRGKVEGVVSVLPLAAMLIVAGGFGILVEAMGYATVFLVLGIVISLSGVAGIFVIRDSEKLVCSGGLRDIFYGFRPSCVRENSSLYVAFICLAIYSVGFQFFMPYLIIYMKSNLGFSPVEYSLAFGLAIVIGGAINVYLGIVSDKKNKAALLYVAAPLMAAGLFAMYFTRTESHILNLVMFAAFGCLMICGYIFISALLGAIIRDLTPSDSAGKLQGVRMVFAVLIPMVIGPMVGNAINKVRGIKLTEPGADAMTTEYLPAPEIFLAGGLAVLVMLALVPWLNSSLKKRAEREENKSV